MGDFAPNPGSRARQGALNKLSSLFKRLVVINFNAAPAPVATSGAALQIVGQDGVQTRLTWDTFANQGSLFFRRADGSAVAPSALLSGETIGVIQMTGYGATSYATPGVRLQIVGNAAENWSDTAQGAYWAFVTTPLTTKAQVEMMRLQPSGGVSIGSAAFNATDPGAGNLAVQGSISAGVPVKGFFGNVLTSVTTISNQQTPTTGGVTLASQALAAGTAWRIRAQGTYTAASSATARNFEVSAFWGATQLTKIAQAVLINTAQTTSWTAEFLLSGSSATALWLTGELYRHTNIALATAEEDLVLATPTSNTGLTTTSTVDLRFDTSVSVVGDSIAVNSVTIERLA